MTAIVSEAPVRAKSGSQARATASTAPSHNEDARARFRKTADLLRQAWHANEAEADCYSGDSDRLIQIAANYASDVGDRIGQDSLTQEAFNVSALISAARMVPGDVEGPTRKALLDRIAPLLRPIASPDGGAEEFGLPHAPRPEHPRLQRSKGLNARQLTTVLEHIAGHADTLTKTLGLLQCGRADEWEDAVVIDAAVLMSRTLVAMADDAVGGAVIGNANRWHYGANFADADADKAGAA